MDTTKLDRIHHLIELKRKTDRELAELIGEAEQRPKRKWTRKEAHEGAAEIAEAPPSEG